MISFAVLSPMTGTKTSVGATRWMTPQIRCSWGLRLISVRPPSTWTWRESLLSAGMRSPYGGVVTITPVTVALPVVSPPTSPRPRFVRGTRADCEQGRCHADT